MEKLNYPCPCGGKVKWTKEKVTQDGVDCGILDIEICNKCGSKYFPEESMEIIENKLKDKGLWGWIWCWLASTHIDLSSSMLSGRSSLSIREILIEQKMKKAKNLKKLFVLSREKAILIRSVNPIYRRNINFPSYS